MKPLSRVHRDTHTEKDTETTIYHSQLYDTRSGLRAGKIKGVVTVYNRTIKIRCFILSYHTRWLPGLDRVPYYAPSPCHYKHPAHNCHHLKSCHPPVKQFITTHHNTEFIYTCSLFFICNNKVSRARTDQSPPHGTSFEVSLPPSLPCSLAPPLHHPLHLYSLH